MKTPENIFAQEKRMIDTINNEGQGLMDNTKFEDWGDIQSRLNQLNKRRRTINRLASALRDMDSARTDCIAGV